MSNEKQKRRYPRVGLPKGMLVAWEYCGVRKTSRVGVLALGGVFIATPEPPRAGETIRLIFEVPGGEVLARALVRDCRPGEGMGVEFTAMTPDARARLNLLMKTLAKS